MHEQHTNRVGLLGWPVEHSLSPAIHQAAFNSQHLPWHYELLPVQPENIEKGIRAILSSDLKGFNITAPYKGTIIPYLSRLDDISRTLGAVNTVKREENGDWMGYNTDVYGFKKALEMTGAFSSDAPIVTLLGNGGAAVAVLAALLEMNVKRIVVLARNEEKSIQLLKRFEADRKINTDIISLSLEKKNIENSLSKNHFIINATPVGMQHVQQETLFAEDISLPEGLRFMDLIYHPWQTYMMEQVIRAGGTAWNGLNMLIYQAAAAYELWTGIKAPIEVMKDAAIRRITK
jgi:shikimate dehydrogenase